MKKVFVLGENTKCCLDGVCKIMFTVSILLCETRSKEKIIQKEREHGPW